jgi:rhodanese-related sulfurtransferase
MTKEEFKKELLTGLTTPPGYFPKNVLMNIQGYESLDTIIDRGNTPLSAEAFELAANETGALILDTRSANEFSNGFIPNSINIGIDGNFAMWVGEMITDIKQEILLITEPGREQESIIRLARVGYDNTIGYLKDGFDTWKKASKEIDMITRITAEEFETRYAMSPIVIDVRKQSEFESEHVVDAMNIPLNQINQKFTEFPTDRAFILHCAGGYRSMIAASILKSRGIEQFVDVIGGMTDILKTNIPKTEYICTTTLL